jgi:hypothetical protein
MVRPKSTIDDQLDAAQVAIDNSLSDPEIMGFVGGYGYNAEKLAEGKALFDSAQAAVNAQGLAAGKQKSGPPPSPKPKPGPSTPSRRSPKWPAPPSATPAD